jgi:hypothetical protein
MLDKLWWMFRDVGIRQASFEDDWVCVNVGFDVRKLSWRRVGSERDWTVLDVDNQVTVNRRLIR